MSAEISTSQGLVAVAGASGDSDLPEGLKKLERAKLLYIRENLKDGDTPYTLRMAAEEVGLSYDYVKLTSSQEKWRDQLKEIVTERMKEVTDATRTFAIYDEVAVRTRQAQFARLAQNKAILRIQALDPDKLTVKEAIELLRLGLDQERRSLGMVDQVVQVNTDTTPATRDVINEALAVIRSLPAPNAG